MSKARQGVYFHFTNEEIEPQEGCSVSISQVVELRLEPKSSDSWSCGLSAADTTASFFLHFPCLCLLKISVED